MSETIKVFTSNGWGPCHMVKLYISRKGLDYTEHNVSLDRTSLKELVGMGYRSTPVTVIGDEKIVGYNTDKIDEALVAAGFV